MNQREKLEKLLIDFCNMKGSRTFTLKELHAKYGNYSNINIGGKTPQATVRRLLQELRDLQFVTFLDRSGCYTLRGIDLLDSERDELKTVNFINETPLKKEYIVETYVRKTKWAKLAVESFGCHCLFKNCNNTFVREDGTQYIEVHHIIPLCKGGENGIWNLSVLCAHHHKMAHFATEQTRSEIQDYLLARNNTKFTFN